MTDIRQFLQLHCFHYVPAIHHRILAIVFLGRQVYGSFADPQ
jgi:hypothetical protein